MCKLRTKKVLYHWHQDEDDDAEQTKVVGTSGGQDGGEPVDIPGPDVIKLFWSAIYGFLF